MSRPLSSFNPNGSILLGNTIPITIDPAQSVALAVCNAADFPLERHPQILKAAMRIIAQWSILETYVGRTFSAIVGGSESPSMAIYQSLGARRTQMTAIEAAASGRIASPQFDVLLALLSLQKKRANFRDRVAHHLWGYSTAAPEGIVLVDPRIYPELEGDVDNIPYSKLTVYDLNDFNDALVATGRLCGHFHDMYFLLGPHCDRADEILQRLLIVPEIQTELSRRNNHTKTAR